MSAVCLCKSKWVLYCSFKIFITQKLLPASWFVSVFLWLFLSYATSTTFNYVLWYVFSSSSIPQSLVLHWKGHRYRGETAHLEYRGWFLASRALLWKIQATLHCRSTQNTSTHPHIYAHRYVNIKSTQSHTHTHTRWTVLSAKKF